MNNKSVNYEHYQTEYSKLLAYFSAYDNPLRGIYDGSVNEIKNEKEALKDLNRRLDEYIDKVTKLEEAKKTLEEKLKTQKEAFSKVNEGFDDERKKLQQEKLNLIKVILQCNELQVKYNEKCIEHKQVKYITEEYEKDIQDAQINLKKLKESEKRLRKLAEISHEVIQEFSATHQMTKEEDERCKKQINEAKDEAVKEKAELDIKTKEWAALKRKVSSLQKQRQEKEETHRTDIALLEQEVATLELKLTRKNIKISAFQNLSKDKVGVQDEITKYGKLLDKGEKKTPPQTPPKPLPQPNPPTPKKTQNPPL